MKEFIQLFGFNKESVTINLKYLIRFQENPKEGTDIWMFNGKEAEHYLITISYKNLNETVFAITV